MNRLDLAKIFRDARIKSRKRQEDVAEKGDIDLSVVQRIEAGSNPTFESMNAFADATGWKLIIMLGESEEAQLIDAFRSLTDQNRKLVIGYVTRLLEEHQTNSGTTIKRSK